MKKLLVAAAMGAALAGNVGAHAATYQGRIEAGHPASGIGVSRSTAACTPGAPTDGVDGQWFEVDPGDSLAVTLTHGEIGNEDLDVEFFEADCGFIDDDSMVNDSTSESGVVPVRAQFILVELFSGAGATFDVVIS